MTPELLNVLAIEGPAWRRPLIMEALARFKAGYRLQKPKLPPLNISRPVKPTGHRSVVKGNLPVGMEVVSGSRRGVIMGFLPPGEAPERFIPPGTPVTLQGGHHSHHAAPIARYCVVVQTPRGMEYHLPKAATVERWAQAFAA